MDLQAFFAENTPPFPEKNIILSDRLPAPFHIRGISEEECAMIRRQAAGKIPDSEPDAESFLSALAAACVTEPDLKNSALQHSYGVIGAEALLKKMLSAGEYARLIEGVQQVCGFDLSVREAAELIKKEPCGATPN